VTKDIFTTLTNTIYVYTAFSASTLLWLDIKKSIQLVKIPLHQPQSFPKGPLA